ncbi:hypothetical protein [Flavobacterium sp. I3-2]|uniref:hypothetical protein n=1 Tax=Flavobacterium sp. I3-2 TaxID=2748319 RepID=UPI0015ADD55B|nr:hypothetical protein [Flavobacterium sp. I3-2]
MEDSIFFTTRLKSKRTKTRLVKTDFEKKIRLNNKRQKELWNEKQTIPLVPLAVPYQKSYVRYFVLRDDIKNEKDITFFSEILKKINTEQFSYSKKFTKKKKQYRKRIDVPTTQYLRLLYPYEYSGKDSKLNEREREYFIQTQVYNQFTKTFQTFYEFIQPWRFRLIVKPNMITHYKPINSELERELAEIDKFCDAYKNRGLYYKKIAGGSYSYHSKPNLKNPFKGKKFYNNKNSASEIAEILSEQSNQVSKRYHL